MRDLLAATALAERRDLIIKTLNVDVFAYKKEIAALKEKAAKVAQTHEQAVRRLRRLVKKNEDTARRILVDPDSFFIFWASLNACLFILACLISCFRSSLSRANRSLRSASVSNLTFAKSCGTCRRKGSFVCGACTFALRGVGDGQKASDGDETRPMSRTSDMHNQSTIREMADVWCHVSERHEDDTT